MKPEMEIDLDDLEDDEDYNTYFRPGKFEFGDIVSDGSVASVCLFPDQRIFIMVEDSTDLNIHLLISKFIRYLHGDWNEHLQVFTMARAYHKNVSPSKISGEEFPPLGEFIQDWVDWIINIPEKELEETMKRIENIIQLMLPWIEKSDRLRLQMKLGLYLEKTEEETLYDSLIKSC